MVRPRATSTGLTLAELLVVFVLVALIATLLIQAFGFFLGRYGQIRDVHRVAGESALRQHWFTSTVQGLVPYGLQSRRFIGDPSAFRGTTLQPLSAEAGPPADIAWTLDEDGGFKAVNYAESGVQWTVLRTEPEAAFEYGDSTRRWHDRWPTTDVPDEWVPSMVRLVSASGRTIWFAKVDASPVPRLVEEMFE